MLKYQFKSNLFLVFLIKKILKMLILSLFHIIKLIIPQKALLTL